MKEVAMGDAPITLVQFSDLHIDPQNDHDAQRFQAVKNRILEQKPDVIVCSGDISDNGTSRPKDFLIVKEKLKSLGQRVYLIPGNHDIGDKVGEKNEVCQDYLDRWLDVFGDDRFSLDKANWLILGLNSQIVGSNLPREAEQFEWLDRHLDEAGKQGKHVAIFLHTPPYISQRDEVVQGKSRYWGFGPSPRKALLQRLEKPHVKLVANGHLHWFHVWHRGHAQHVWCPGAYLIVDDALYPRGGDHIGIVKYTLTDNAVKPTLCHLDLPSKKILFNPDGP